MKRTIILLTTTVCAGLVLIWWELSRLSWNLIQSDAKESVARYTRLLEELHSLYTSQVAAPLTEHGIELSHDSATKKDQAAVPLPGSFVIMLGKRITQTEAGTTVRLYSDYPFPWRKAEGGPRDAFEQEALVFLREHPDGEFVNFEEVNGQHSVRYAVADRMRAACVDCHNAHPDSPKTDWRPGDVRGVLEVTRPLDSSIARTRSGLRGTFILTASLTVASLGGLIMVIGRLRRDASKLERHAHALEGEIAENQRGVGPGPRSGAGGQPSQEHLPGQHEP
jgi:hypothetical protein